jgi:hypothetical protein
MSTEYGLLAELRHIQMIHLSKQTFDSATQSVVDGTSQSRTDLMDSLVMRCWLSAMEEGTSDT